MKFPSLQQLGQSALKTVRRFPVPVFIAWVGTTVALVLIELNSYYYETRSKEIITLLERILRTCSLGLPASLAVNLYAQMQRFRFRQHVLAQGLVIALLLVYFLSSTDTFNFTEMLRFALLFVAVHLLVACLPYFSAGSSEQNGFWQYNKSLFLRILTAILYTGVLYTGLVIALVAIDQLFNVTIKSERYFQLFALLTGLFNTIFFLSGVPDDWESLQNDNSYPKGLKVFTQFVLLPLVTVYLLILYGYAIKIMFAGELPEGWVSYLVISFSVAGIFSLLLIEPIRNTQAWIGTFGRWFYLALLPMIGLLFLAIRVRVATYGITENRYIVLIIAGWLTVTALYFLVSKKRQIRLIPISLCILALLSCAGPWSAFAVAERSQLGLLRELVSRNSAQSPQVSFEVNQRISSIARFFAAREKEKLLATFLPAPVDSVLADTNTLYETEKATRIVKAMGYRYVNEWEDSTNSEQYVYYYAETPDVLPVGGYDYLLTYPNPQYNSVNRKQYATAGDSLLIITDKNHQTLLLLQQKDTLLRVDVQTFAEQLHKRHQGETQRAFPVSEMTLTSQSRRASGQLTIGSLSLQERNDSLLIRSFDARLLLKLSAPNEDQQP